jgi:hypothetical protein
MTAFLWQAALREVGIRTELVVASGGFGLAPAHHFVSPSPLNWAA